MSDQIFGLRKGLSHSELKRIGKLYNRRLDRHEVITNELAKEIWQVAHDIGRRVGVIISRDGDVEFVIVGSREILYLPDLGRYRLGAGRLRNLRLVFSDLSRSDMPTIPHDIYTDLEKLRLDMVISTKIHKGHLSISYAHLIPLHHKDSTPTRTETIKEISRWNLDLAEFMTGLEEELSATTDDSIYEGSDGAVLVGVYEKRAKQREDCLAELESLAHTAGITVLGKVIQNRDPDPKTLLGKGKIEQVVLKCLRLGADTIIFDTELKPTQWRIITNSTELKVIDRSMLILDIFSQRAHSADGRLQVELAQLKYNLPKLVEKDAGLSRLTGGIGGRGPGETKLEIGRRRARDRISELEKQIDKLSLERELRRKRQKESRIPLIAIVGYTNVGKSTLLNALTGSSAFVEDKLFATLQPTRRRLFLPNLQTSGNITEKFVILTDTVGFIRSLPHELFNAFRATLEELREASLLLHVIDASDPYVIDRKAAVDEILRSMEISEIPTITVLNKIDQSSDAQVSLLAKDVDGYTISAKDKIGFDALLLKIAEMLNSSLSPSTKEEKDLGPLKLHKALLGIAGIKS